MIKKIKYKTSTIFAALLAATVVGLSFADASDQNLEAIVSQLEHRVQTLKAMDGVENLQRQFGYHFDKKQWDDVAALFADDGSFETGQRGVYSGRDRIRSMLEAFYGESELQDGELFDHMQLQPIIDVSADGLSAKARWRAIVQKGQRGNQGFWAGGIFENEYVKQGDNWFIKKLHYYDTYEANYDGGWTQSYIPIATVSKDFPPDEPPSEIFQFYPEVYLPLFHYDHPAHIKHITPTAIAGITTSGPIQTRLQDLQHNIHTMEDEAAIEKVQRAYGYYVDKGLWQEAAQLFAEDGTLEIGGRGIFTGRDRVLQYYRYLGHEGPQRGALVNHIQLQPIVSVNSDGTAEGRFTFLAQIGVIPPHELDAQTEIETEKAKPSTEESQAVQSQDLFRTGMWGIGTYENEFENIDGVWYIKKLYGVFRMYTFYGPGWAHHAEPMTRPEQRMPPDLAPSVVYDMYPTAYFPPFHYKHPVTGLQHRPVSISSEDSAGGER